MSAAGEYFSIPIFQKDHLSLDFPRAVEVKEGVSLPSLEHALWYLLGLDVKETHTCAYLRSKLRNKRGFVEKAMRNWDTDEEIRLKFSHLWKEQIMEHKDYKEMFEKHNELPSLPTYYCIIPKNKGSLYKTLAWNPEISTECDNRLGDLFRHLVASCAPQKSSITPIVEEIEDEEMLRNTFCPDCESLLFIRQKTGEDGHPILSKHCQVCGWEKEMEEEEMNTPIYASHGKKQKLALSDHDIEEILQDPTLPRINNIPCVNPLCATNHLVEEEYGFILPSMKDAEKRNALSSQPRAETIGEDGLILFADKEEDLVKRISDNGIDATEGSIIKGPVERMILYYRTNPDDLTFSYVCSTCKTIWSNHS